MQMKTDGIVLREQKYNENDRLLTVLTRKYGLVYAYARGADKLKSRLSTATKQFCYSDFILFKNKERCLVDTADSKKIFFGISSSLEKLALSSYLAQLCIYLSPQSDDSEQILRLLLNCLYMLDENKRSDEFIKPLFELRLASLCGFMPNLVACSNCLTYESENMYLDAEKGEIICSDCAEKIGIDTTRCALLTPSVLTAMRHIVFSDFNKLFSFKTSQETLEMLGSICEWYLKDKLEHHFETLDFYHSVK